ncbi:hypothetical protein KQX54_016067 [Cotesia glomerata]|uniref:Uncharacterized protein n=1 Tax=Cotesia glomerata TaxID=32391 RepID=A0AAV7IR80_COTGL|nr:hypothetical protein KQX54_016067 [Cotesia glomerata]
MHRKRVYLACSEQRRPLEPLDPSRSSKDKFSLERRALKRDLHLCKLVCKRECESDDIESSGTTTALPSPSPWSCITSPGHRDTLESSCTRVSCRICNVPILESWRVVGIR